VIGSCVCVYPWVFLQVPLLFERLDSRHDEDKNEWTDFDHEQRRTALFHELFFLLRDVHDEHDYAYRSPHPHWPGKFDETRAALVWLVMQQGTRVDSVIMSELARIRNPANDMVNRGELGAREMMRRQIART
jgi:hypothetical protein